MGHVFLVLTLRKSWLSLRAFQKKEVIILPEIYYIFNNHILNGWRLISAEIRMIFTSFVWFLTDLIKLK